MADEEKKIIIDEDWKTQAQKEKEELKEAEQQKAEAGGDEGMPMPEADFAGLVSMLATQAFYALGLIRPEGAEDAPVEPNFVIAKYNIDTLGMLGEKCKGNLTDDEQKMLTDTLAQLRMLFVQLTQAKPEQE